MSVVPFVASCHNFLVAAAFILLTRKRWRSAVGTCNKVVVLAAVTDVTFRRTDGSTVESTCCPHFVTIELLETIDQLCIYVLHEDTRSDICRRTQRDIYLGCAFATMKIDPTPPINRYSICFESHTHCGESGGKGRGVRHQVTWWM